MGSGKAEVTMKLLFVDDEPRIQEIVRNGLAQDGFEVETFSTAEEVMSVLQNSRPSYDAFLLDIVLPGLSGLELCRWLRETGHKQAIVMLTAKGQVDDKVAGLDAGADDYLAKPFEVAELQARFRALYRKMHGYPRPPLVVGDLVMDPNTQRVTRGGVELGLPKKEKALLEFLMKNSNRVVTRSMIANALWDEGSGLYTNVIDVFIAYLRKRIDTPSRPRLLHTVRGKGFRLSINPLSDE